MAFGLLQGAAVLAWLVQLALNAGFDNVASATVVLLASTATCQFLRINRSFVHQPFSSLAVLGLCLTTQWGALIAQSCALTPVADNLRTPLNTFGLLAGYQLVAIAALWLSAHASSARALRTFLSQRVLEPLQIFAAPAPGALWCLGLAGFASILVHGALQEGGGVIAKLIDGVRFLTWAPFIVPILASRAPGYCNLRRQSLALGAYVLAVIALGMAVNARSVMFVGVMTVLLLMLVLVLGSDERVERSRLWKIVPAMVVTAMAIGYASDLAIATVLVRDQRKSAGALEMIELTVETLFDAQVMDTFKDSVDAYSKVAIYDEYYISNQVLTRLIETKFHDNMFFLSSSLRPDELAALRKHALESTWATLPEPILRLLDMSVDKANLGYSVGDLFDYLHYGNELGGYKIGSIFAHGQALFGAWFFFVYLIMCVFVFIVWDSFSRKDPDGKTAYAPVAMLSVFTIFFNTISGDSIIVVVGFLVRGTTQTVVIYSLLLAATQLIAKSIYRPSANSTGMASQ